MKTEEEFNFEVLSRRWSYSSIRTIIVNCHDIIDGLHLKKEYSMKYVLAESFAKALTTFEEIITLTYHCYPDGAFALTRTLYENYVIMLFIRVYQTADDEMVKKFIDSYMLESNMLEKLYYTSILESIKETGVESNNVMKLREEISEQIQIANNELLSFYQLYPFIEHSNRKDYWWAEKIIKGASFGSIQAKLIADNHLPKIFKVHYKHACSRVHCGFYGLLNKFGVDTDDIIYSHAYEGYELPLGFSLLIFRGHVKVFSEYFNIDALNTLAINLDTIMEKYLPSIYGIA